MPSLQNDQMTPVSRPPVDEWGMYDPEQAGLAALYARLQTIRRVANTPVDGRLVAASMREVRRLVNRSER